MTVLNLTPQEQTRLRKCVTRHRPQVLNELEVFLARGIADSALITELQTAITVELMRAGFDSEYEPNEYGAQLEDLLGRLGEVRKREI